MIIDLSILEIKIKLHYKLKLHSKSYIYEKLSLQINKRYSTMKLLGTI